MPQYVLSVKGLEPPPLYARCGRPKGKVGRPMKRRIQSRGESSNVKTRKASCSICGQAGHNMTSCTNFAKSVSVSNLDYKPTEMVVGCNIQMISTPSTCIYQCCTNCIDKHHICSTHLGFIQKLQLNPVSQSDVQQWGAECDNHNVKCPDGCKNKKKKQKIMDADEDDFQEPPPPSIQVEEDLTLIKYDMVVNYFDTDMSKTLITPMKKKEVYMNTDTWRTTFEDIFNHPNKRSSRWVCTINHVQLSVKHFHAVLKGIDIDACIVNTWFRLALHIPMMKMFFIDTSLLSAYVKYNNCGPIGVQYQNVPNTLICPNSPLISMDGQSILVIAGRLPYSGHWVCIQVDVANRTISFFNPGGRDKHAKFYCNSIMMLMEKHSEIFEKQQWSIHEITTDINMEPSLQVCYYGRIHGMKSNAQPSSWDDFQTYMIHTLYKKKIQHCF